jgi:formyltetrahydrofolate deformylase
VTPPTSDAVVVLTVRCNDQRGVVASVTGAIWRTNGNILDLAQHTDLDEGLFGCRVEIAADVDVDALNTQMTALASSMGIEYRLYLGRRRARLVVACSKSLHCASDLLARVDLGELDCDVAAIVSDHPVAETLARRYGVDFHYLPVGEDRADQEARLAELLGTIDPDLIVLARYMRVLPPSLTDAFPERIINVHHSFLPAFVGADPYRRAVERGVKMVGATAHYVTAELDAGPIIEQDVARVSHRHSVEALKDLGRDLERRVLARAVRWHCEDRVIVHGNKTVVFS